MTVSLDVQNNTWVSHFGAGHGNTSSVSKNFSTGGTNRIVIVVPSWCQASALTINSVTLGGVNLAQYATMSSTLSAGSDGGTQHNHFGVDVWWGYFAAQQTAQALVVTASGVPDVNDNLAWAVYGQNSNTSPWDSDASLPAEASNTSLSSLSQVSVPSVSTSQAHTMLFQVGGAKGRPAAVGTGWSLIFQQTGYEDAWNATVDAFAQYKSLSGTISGQTESFDTTNLGAWDSIVFGITSDGTGAVSAPWICNLIGV